jgi:hypothetical protein
MHPITTVRDPHLPASETTPLPIVPDPQAPNADPQAIAAAEDARTQAEAAFMQNSILMRLLTMALVTPQLSCLIDTAKTDAYPDGEAHLVFKALHQQFQPNEFMAPFTFRQKLSQVHLQQVNQSPRELLDTIEALTSEFQQPYTPDVLLSALMTDQTPTPYRLAITTKHRIKGWALTVEEIEEVMIVTYDTVYASSNSQIQEQEEDSNDMALYAAQPPAEVDRNQQCRQQYANDNRG